MWCAIPLPLLFHLRGRVPLGLLWPPLDCVYSSTPSYPADHSGGCSGGLWEGGGCGGGPGKASMVQQLAEPVLTKALLGLLLREAREEGVWGGGHAGSAI